MAFAYCPYCGKKLGKKEIGDEGVLPYCEQCGLPFWEEFSVSVICAVLDEKNEIALLRQDYVSRKNEVCVAGYIQKGETAEETAVREIKEELGLSVQKLHYVRSYYYDKKRLLMLGYLAEVRRAGFVYSKEVDSARWVPLDEAPDCLREGGIAWQLVSRIRRDLYECKGELSESGPV